MKQARSLRPVPYAHVVFTVPTQLAPLALRNQRVLYNLLFRAASETLLEIAADPRHLGARICVLAVLHTWSQNLRHHPHLHCLVPAGGLALDNSRWVATRRGLFLPVRVLSRMFRGKLLAFLKQSYRRNELCFAASWLNYQHPEHFTLCLVTCADGRNRGMFRSDHRFLRRFHYQSAEMLRDPNTREEILTVQMNLLDEEFCAWETRMQRQSLSAKRHEDGLVELRPQPTPAEQLKADALQERWVQRYLKDEFTCLGFTNVKGPFNRGPDYRGP